MTSAPKPKTAKDLAEAMGVHEATVHRWHDKPGFPKKKRGAYDVEAIAAWRSAAKKAAKSYSANQPKITEANIKTTEGTDWDAEYRKQKALKEQIAVKELRKLLMPVSRVEKMVAGQIQVVRSGLISLVRRLPARLEGLTKEEIFKALDTEVHALLRGFVSGEPCVPRERVDELIEWLEERRETYDDEDAQSELQDDSGELE